MSFVQTHTFVIVEWIVVSICYFCFLLSIGRCYQVWFVYQKPSFPSNVKTIHCIIPIGLIVRAIVLTLGLTSGTDPTQPVLNQTEPYQIIMGGLPGYLYFGVYAILALAFVERYQIWSLGTIASRVILGAILVFVLVAFFSFGFLSVYQAENFETSGHIVETLFSVSIHGLLSFVFTAMSVTSIYFNINTHPHKVRHKMQHIIVTVLSVMAAVTFAGKGAFIGCYAFYKGSEAMRIAFHWVYVLFFEICLAAAICIVLAFSLPSTTGANNSDSPRKKPTTQSHGIQENTPGLRSILSFTAEDFEEEETSILHDNNNLPQYGA